MDPAVLTGLLGLAFGGAIGGAIAATVVSGRLDRIRALTDERVAAENAAQQARESASAAGQTVERLQAEIERTERERDRILNERKAADAALQKVKHETRQAQALAGQEQRLRQSIERLTAEEKRKQIEASQAQAKLNELTVRLRALMGRLDLYSRIDAFVDAGHYEAPKYLFETSERYQVELKRIREEQRKLIQEGQAIDLPKNFGAVENKTATERVLKNQAKLLLRAFNIECDLLIEKVNPGNLSRTLQQIEKLAADLDKLAASLHCGVSPRYVELKYKECSIYYEYRLRKQEEQEEQRAIREQIREEAKAKAEAERAQRDAERDEAKFERLLALAKAEVAAANSAEKELVAQKVRDLELRLAEAIAQRERAKSLAEQTRRGHVYIISNVGSFGEDVYKIGLTRRIDPQERVDELGDASVPFSFDVHAFIYSEDAPRLENELHQAFKDRRVNAVNLRKEFFRVSLQEVRELAERIVGDDLDLRTTITAEEYYETRRLLSARKETLDAALLSNGGSPGAA